MVPASIMFSMKWDSIVAISSLISIMILITINTMSFILMMLRNKILFYFLHLKSTFQLWTLFFQSLSVSADWTSHVVMLMFFKTTCFQFYFGISNYSDWWKYVSIPRVQQGSDDWRKVTGYKQLDEQMCAALIWQLQLFVLKMIWLKLTTSWVK